MKKLKSKPSTIKPISGIGEKKEAYEIIYADPRDEEIHLKILKKVQLNAQMARWFLDLEYNQLLWSDGVYEILEIDSKKSGASYDVYMNVIHPEDRSIKESAQKTLFKTKKPIEIVYRLLMNDKRIKWINEICNTDYDNTGSPIRFYGIIQDITKYKLSEEKYIQKEERYKTLIDSLPTGIAIYQNKIISFINPAGIRILGAKNADEITGQPISRILSSNSIKNLNQIIQEITYFNFEETFVRLDGSIVEVGIEAIRTTYEGTPAVQIIINDLSERKKTERAITKSEEQIRLLTENISEVVWAINPEGSFTYISPSVKDIIGYTSDEALKLEPAKFLTAASVSLCTTKWETVKQALLSGVRIDPSKIILELINKDGSTRWAEVTGNAMYDSANNFNGFSGLCLDISEKMKAEQRLTENELQLKELIATKDNFISLIAHDLRSPFNSILGFLELLLTQYDDLNDIERKEYLQLVSDDANKTLILLENLLLWAKSQTGKIAYVHSKQKLLPIIQSVAHTLNYVSNQKNINLDISISNDFEIFGDSNMLTTIFQNLINNAFKYSFQGGTVLIKSHKNQDHIEIIVADNGTGIDKDLITKLFKVEERVSIPGTANEKGSGLGLILCKDFVEKLGGSISVKSELGKGSQFTVRIPQ